VLTIISKDSLHLKDSMIDKPLYVLKPHRF